MKIGQAGADDVAALARLLWLDTRHEDPAPASGGVDAGAGGAAADAFDAFDTFVADLARWWAAHRDSHHAFTARDGGPGIVGMAWVALAPRVPRPGATARAAGDIQSVYVLPGHRGRGIGSALVAAAADHAAGLGALRVTVHSGSRAVPVYERLGFAPSPRLLLRAADRGGDAPARP